MMETEFSRRRRRRLNGTCANALRMAVAELNEAVLQAVEEHALRPQAIEQVVHLSERDDVADQQARLAREGKDVDTRIARLVAAIETGGDAASLTAKLRELEARRQAINVEAGRLLDRYYKKNAEGVASPTGFDPFRVSGIVLHRVA